MQAERQCSYALTGTPFEEQNIPAQTYPDEIGLHAPARRRYARGQDHTPPAVIIWAIWNVRIGNIDTIT